jgi:hypothetical protein
MLACEEQRQVSFQGSMGDRRAARRVHLASCQPVIEDQCIRGTYHDPAQHLEDVAGSTAVQHVVSWRVRVFE